MKRVLTALALIPIVGWVVLFANSWIFLAVLVTVACLCYREYNDIAAAYGFGAPGVVGYGAGLLVLVWWDLPWLALVGITVAVLILVMREEHLEHALPRAALLVTGILYVFGCWKCARPLREINPHWLMYGLMLNWVGDIGAYYLAAWQTQASAAHQPQEILVHHRSSPGWWAPSILQIFFLRCLCIARLAPRLGQHRRQVATRQSAMKRGANVRQRRHSTRPRRLPGPGG
jgi:hypothetical protein